VYSLSPSYRRKPVSSVFGDLQIPWAPAFTGKPRGGDDPNGIISQLLDDGFPATVAKPAVKRTFAGRSRRLRDYGGSAISLAFLSKCTVPCPKVGTVRNKGPCFDREPLAMTILPEIPKNNKGKDCPETGRLHRGILIYTSSVGMPVGIDSPRRGI
jgi:hypothetical protein